MLSREFVRSRLDYDPHTGQFTWRERAVVRSQDASWNKRRAGTTAGSLNSEGYVEVFLDTRSYKAHHLAWVWVHGFSVPIIDHINGVRSDNRLANLRPANRNQNAWNSAIPKNNRSGVKGVHFNPQIGKWVAGIKANGGAFHLGVFESKDDAAKARAQAEIKLHGRFAASVCRAE